jgi:hypothetical protein
MKIFLLFFVVTFCSAFNVDTFVSTVVAVRQHYRSGCVYLLHGQHTGEPHCVKIAVISVVLREKCVKLSFTKLTSIAIIYFMTLN